MAQPAEMCHVVALEGVDEEYQGPQLNSGPSLNVTTSPSKGG
jgi:hypothetical protein